MLVPRWQLAHTSATLTWHILHTSAMMTSLAIVLFAITDIVMCNITSGIQKASQINYSNGVETLLLKLMVTNYTKASSYCCNQDLACMNQWTNKAVHGCVNRVILKDIYLLLQHIYTTNKAGIWIYSNESKSRFKWESKNCSPESSRHENSPISQFTGKNILLCQGLCSIVPV